MSLKIEGLQVLDYVLAVAKDTIRAMSADLNRMQKAVPFTLREMGQSLQSREYPCHNPTPIRLVHQTNPFMSKTLPEVPQEVQAWTSAHPPEQY